MLNPTIVKVLEAADQLSAQLNRNRALFEKIIQKAQQVRDAQEQRGYNSQGSTDSLSNLPPAAHVQQERAKPTQKEIEKSEESERERQREKQKEQEQEKEKEKEKQHAAEKERVKEEEKEKVRVEEKVREEEKKEEARQLDEQLRRKVEELAQENLDLVDSIKEYQETLDLVMAKHRQLMAKLQNERQAIYQETQLAIWSEKEKNLVLQQENVELREKIAEMVDVMRIALAAGDDPQEDEQNILLHALKQENDGLREMLEISVSMQS